MPVSRKMASALTVLPGATAPVDVLGLPSFAPLSNPALGVYAVVDSAAWVRRVLQSGIRTVQLRIKTPDAPDKSGRSDTLPPLPERR